MIETNNIFEGKKEKRFLQIVIPRDLADKLKKINSGSYADAIRQLLQVSIDKRIFERIKELEERIDKLEDMFNRP
jgi:transcription elongation factor GreA-like protein